MFLENRAFVSAEGAGRILSPLTFGLLAFGGCAPSCSGTEPIVEVTFVGPSGSAGFPVDTAAAEARVRDLAGELKGFSVRSAGAEEVGWQLTIRTEMATERTDDRDPSKVRRALGASAELRRLQQGPESIYQHLAEVMEVQIVSPGAPSTPLVEGTLEVLMARLETSVSLSKARSEALEEAILGEDAFGRAVAVRMVKERGLKDLAPALERRLDADDLNLQESLRIAGALASLEDPSTAGALINTISRFPEATIPIVFLLGRLGGREARAYLFTVQSGHERDEVRKAARQALEQ